MRTHISHQPIVSCFRCLVCRLIKLQFRDRLCILTGTGTDTGHQPIMPGFRCQVCRLVKLKLGDCLYCFWSNQLLCIYLHRW